MKKIIIVLFTIIIIFTATGFKIYSDALKVIKNPFAGNTGNINVSVNNGDSLNGVLSTLYKENKIGNAFLVKWYIKNHRLSTNIKPGDYIVEPNMSLENFIAMLNEGKYNENAIKVTIPEGYNLEAIASLLEEKSIISKENFIESCKKYELPNYIKVDDNRKYALEGYLFPDTYEFIKGMAGKEIIDIMIKNFEKNIQDIEKNSNTAIDKQEIDNIIIMASIIEKEAEASDERPVVSSVFYNRLNEKMPLQSCATVEYALGIHKTVYTYDDLKVDSPYNTYKVKALPVGPICNPGKSAIEAALSPAKTDYLYFVSKFDGTKTHFFTRDYNEFLQYKKKSDENLAKMNK